MSEFISMSSLGENSKPLIFLLDDETITISGSDSQSRAISGWVDYFRHAEQWVEHLQSDSPLSSLFRSAYLNIERHELTDRTRPVYEAMISSISAPVEKVTVTLP